MLFFWTFYLSKNRNKKDYAFHKSGTTVLNIDNKKKGFLSTKSKHIRLISEGSCETEDWSNDAENPRNNVHLKHIWR